MFVFGFVVSAQPWSATLWCNRIFSPKWFWLNLLFFPSSCWIVAFFRIFRDVNQIDYRCVCFILLLFCCSIYLDFQICSVWAAPAINKANTMKWRRWREWTHVRLYGTSQIRDKVNFVSEFVHPVRTHIHTSALIYHRRYFVWVHVFSFFILVNFRCIILRQVFLVVDDVFQREDLKNT